jgi:predicted metal-dependent phosphoesterase TrpH
MYLTFGGRVTREDKARNDYLYVPFELPLPARRLHVRYRYSQPISHDQSEGGNVIDIGIFDPRGAGFPGGAGFRGWSGSDRSTFTLGCSAAETTPGYLPGPLPAGRYQIILGLYRIWPGGADYEIEIEADLDETATATFEPPAEVAAGPAAGRQTLGDAGEAFLWLCGDLQSHTFHSDGKGSPAQLAAKARALGLDFLAITDHNTTSHHASLPELAGDDLLLIPGQEVTTYYGHMNVWGTSRWCDFRSRTEAEMRAIVDFAHDNGGICSINHPKTGGPPWEYELDLPVDAMEVWHGPWPHHNEESLALWERALRSGRRLPAVGGSDYHCPAGEETGFLRLGQPATWVKATDRSVSAVLDALRAGRASISAAPDGPRLDLQAEAAGAFAGMGESLALPAGRAARVTVEVTAAAGQTLCLLTEAGVVHETRLDSGTATVTVEMTAGRFIRAELVADMPREQLPDGAPADLDLRRWRWALANPIYIA